MRRIMSGLVALALLLGSGLAVAPRALAQGQACFAQTGQCIQGRFLDYWQAHGGLPQFGYPLSGERRELLEDGRTYTVQYFERARMEEHPENPAPWDVELGQFGRRVLRDQFGFDVAAYQAAVAPAQPAAGQAFFPQTGHNLGGRFLAYWQANGGLAQFGYPLTEAFTQGIGGQDYTVQYFERARLELHPENAAPWDVELGQFGRQVLAETDRLTASVAPGTPPTVQFTPFGLLYLRAAAVRERLGGPAQPAVQQQGAALEFEHGRMIERRDPGGLGQIYVFCGGLEGGQALTTSRLTFEFPDTWQAGQPAGGGPGPAPGLYEPSQGFGQLWRTTPAVRDCLGYATAADATAYTITAQVFNLGRLLTLPDGQTAYVVWGAGAPGGGLAGHYERIGISSR